MFLIVFATLVISIVGLFAQVYSVQSARLYNHQTALMQTMGAWHAGAINAVHALQPTNPSGMTGCRLTSSGSSSLTGCSNGGAVWVTSAYLPNGYNIAAYSFMSVLFQTSSPAVKYIVTYAHDTDASGALKLPDSSGSAVGYSLNDLVLQFNRSNHPNLFFGTVQTSGILTVVTSGSGAVVGSMPYPIPTSVPVGAAAVISAAQ